MPTTARPEATGRRRLRAATTTPHIEDTLGDDLLRGCKRIAAFLGQPQRTTYHQLIQKQLPATKVGAIWIGSKTRLRRYFQGTAAAIDD